MEAEDLSRPQMGGATEHAMQRVLLMIMSGGLAPGEQIRQQEMAEQCGISRVPLREALNMLAQHGLLVHRPNQGYFVAKRGPGELSQIRRMLSLLENEVMQTLVWPEPHQLDDLRALNDRMRDNVASPNWGEFAAWNREFHVRILGFSPYRLIADEIRRLYTLADPFFGVKFELPSARVTTVVEHEQIIAALHQRSRDALMLAVETHRHSNAAGFTQAMAGNPPISPAWRSVIPG